jgi:hypothetical protein
LGACRIPLETGLLIPSDKSYRNVAFGAQVAWAHSDNLVSQDPFGLSGG